MDRRRFVLFASTGVSAAVLGVLGISYVDSLADYERYARVLENNVLGKYDCGIVLGGGELEDESLSRVDAGINSYRKGFFKKLVFASSKFAEPAKNYAVGNGVPFDDVVLENLSNTTVGNAYYSKRNVVSPNGWRRSLIISSDFHIPRVRFIFRKVLGDNYMLDFLGVKTSPQRFEGYAERERWLHFVHRLLFAGVTDGDHEAVKQLYDFLGVNL